MKGPSSYNIDRARITELFRFHLVVAVFAFSHIFVNIQVAVFIIYVFYCHFSPHEWIMKRKLVMYKGKNLGKRRKVCAAYSDCLMFAKVLNTMAFS